MLTIEIVGAIWLTFAIFMLGRGYRWWLFYAAANIPFSIITIDAGRWGYTLMGLICCFSGIRNYCISKRKEKIEADKKAMSRLR
jgi:hypothetical protein